MVIISLHFIIRHSLKQVCDVPTSTWNYSANLLSDSLVGLVNLKELLAMNMMGLLTKTVFAHAFYLPDTLSTLPLCGCSSLSQLCCAIFKASSLTHTVPQHPVPCVCNLERLWESEQPAVADGIIKVQPNTECLTSIKSTPEALPQWHCTGSISTQPHRFLVLGCYHHVFVARG